MTIEEIQLMKCAKCEEAYYDRKYKGQKCPYCNHDKVIYKQE